MVASTTRSCCSRYNRRIDWSDRRTPDSSLQRSMSDDLVLVLCIEPFESLPL